MTALVQAMLTNSGVSYVQVGAPRGLNNNPPPSGSVSCANPATTLSDFACWVTYEHSSLTYAALLGVSTAGLVDRSADLSSTMSGRHPRLEAKAAAARSQMPRP